MTNVSTVKKVALLLMPILAPLTVYWILSTGTSQLGQEIGFGLGYGFYWIFWCLVFPIWLVGSKGLKQMFRSVPNPFGKPAWWGALILLIPIVAAYFFVRFLGADEEMVPQSIIVLVIGTILMSLWNGTLEEILWRGSFIQIFPKRAFLGFLYPALGFSLWHFGPFLALYSWDTQKAIVLFIGGTLFGLCWNWIAAKTGSIRLATYSHILSNIVLMLTEGLMVL